MINNTPSKNVWGVTSTLYKIPNIDENYVEEYTGKILSAQNNQLDFLKEDLAEWINKTLEFRYLTGNNIFQELENGSVLWHLGKAIVAKAKHAVSMGLTKKPLPKIAQKHFENAMPGSFFSRDNMENFLNFCRTLGIHQNLLFESDDLVLHTRHRNVIICLMEVARLSGYYGVEPPKLIQLEKDIEQEEIKLLNSEIDSQLSWQFQSLPTCYDYETAQTPSPVAMEPKTSSVKFSETPEILDSSFTSLPLVNGNESVKKSKNIKNVSFYEYFQAKMCNETDLPFDELDKKVEQAVKKLHWYNCRCSYKKYRNLKISKIGKSKYSIAGRNVFVRVLKNCNMMVRIGGGWDTLDHFLSRLDPCQANGKYLKPQTMASNYTKKYTYYSTFNKILRPGESAV